MNKNIDDHLAALGGCRPIGSDKACPLQVEEILQIEKNIQSPLPGIYRNFLHQYGTSTFDEVIFYYPVVPFPHEMTKSGKGWLMVFYGSIHDVHPNYGLLTRIRYFAGRIFPSLIPIADSGSGDQVCLGVSGDETGKVYFWDLEAEPIDATAYLSEYGKEMSKDERFSNVYLVSDSFEDFLLRLEIDPCPL